MRLVKLHRMWEEVGHELNDYERRRDNVPDSQRAKLESMIEKRKEWMKQLKDIELELREDL